MTDRTDFFPISEPVVSLETDLVFRTKKQFSDIVSASIANLPESGSCNADVASEPDSRIPSLREYADCFRDYPLIPAEKVVRDAGDSTIFTSSGIQHLENLFKRRLSSESYRFSVAQPVIRTQFTDQTCNGTSTSFINFSAVSLNSTHDDFLSLFQGLIQLVSRHGVDFSEMELNFEEAPHSWSNVAYRRIVVSLLVRGIEIGEVIHMMDFPMDGSRKATITDLGIGFERLRWSLDSDSGFFQEFERQYEGNDPNEVTAVLDCVRTSVLIASESVLPSNKNSGYRIRQMIKKFVERNVFLDFDFRELAGISYDYWKNNGHLPAIDKEKTIGIVGAEYERAMNAQTLKLIEEGGGGKFYVEINQPRKNFLKQLSISLPKSAYGLIPLT